MLTIATNPRAFHRSFLERKMEAGLVLTGGEIKSLRAKRVSLTEGFVRLKEGEAFLQNVYIAPHSGVERGYDPLRQRKLLLKKEELAILAQGKEKNLTIVPLRVYITRNVAKVEIALARGKKQFEQTKEAKKMQVAKDIKRELRGKPF